MTEAQRQLAERNHNLIYYFLNKNHLEDDEWYDLAAIGLCKAAESYDGKYKFSTLAYKCMWSLFLNEKRKEQSRAHIPESQILYYEAKQTKYFDDAEFNLLNYRPSRDNVEAEVIAGMIFDEFCRKLRTDEERTIYKLIMLGYTQPEIAKAMNCSDGRIQFMKKRFAAYVKGR